MKPAVKLGIDSVPHEEYIVSNSLSVCTFLGSSPGGSQARMLENRESWMVKMDQQKLEASLTNNRVCMITSANAGIGRAEGSRVL